MISSTLFVELDKTSHECRAFDCGNRQLNTFIHLLAARQRAAGVSVTWVLPVSQVAESQLVSINGVPEPGRFCAYYTLTFREVVKHSDEATPGSVPAGLSLPVLVISHLAVHKTFAGNGLGMLTLVQALKHCYEISRQLPSKAVLANGFTENTYRFYQQFGFERLQPPETGNSEEKFYLPMKTVNSLFDGDRI